MQLPAHSIELTQARGALAASDEIVDAAIAGEDAATCAMRNAILPGQMFLSINPEILAGDSG